MGKHQKIILWSILGLIALIAFGFYILEFVVFGNHWAK